jgi:hypothetical protein
MQAKKETKKEVRVSAVEENGERRGIIHIMCVVMWYIMILGFTFTDSLIHCLFTCPFHATPMPYLFIHSHPNAKWIAKCENWIDKRSKSPWS